MDAFHAAVAEALAQRDLFTATIPVIFMGGVQRGFRALPDIKARTAAKKAVSDRIKALMDDPATAGNLEAFADVRHGIGVRASTRATRSATTTSRSTC